MRTSLITAAAIALVAMPVLAQGPGSSPMTPAPRNPSTMGGPPAAAPRPPMPNPLTQEDLSRVKGTDVYGTDDKKIGSINTVLMDPQSKTIDRLVDLFLPADQPQVRLSLAIGLRLIVGQRLVPNPDRSRVHAAIELLPGSTPLSAIIRDNKTFQIPSLHQRGKALGIVRLDDSLADLVKTGCASVEDVLPMAESPQELEAALKGKPVGLAPGMALAPR